MEGETAEREVETTGEATTETNVDNNVDRGTSETTAEVEAEDTSRDNAEEPAQENEANDLPEEESAGHQVVEGESTVGEVYAESSGGPLHNNEETASEVGGGSMDAATEVAVGPANSTGLEDAEETMVVNESQTNFGGAAFLPETPSDAGDSFDYDSLYDFGQNGESTNLEPDNPLLDRAQAALKLQLETNYQQLSEELREKEAGLKESRRKREEVGVRLYSAQQLLAKTHLGLEQAKSDYEKMFKERQETEESSLKQSEILKAKKKQVEDEQKHLETLQKDLQQLRETRRQVEEHTEQAMADIAVTKRAAAVAEEQMTQLEREKKDQDLLIDRLQDEIRSKKKAISLAEAQLQAQCQETAMARETLAEATQEMENVIFEKKQLMQQWKSALIALGRRDEALQERPRCSALLEFIASEATEESLRQQQEAASVIDSEIRGLVTAIKNQQEENEALTGILRRIEGEADFLTKNMNTLQQKTDILYKEYGLLKQDLEKMEESERQETETEKATRLEIRKLDGQIASLVSAIHDIEASILEKLSVQTATEKNSQVIVQETKQLRNKVRTLIQNSVQLQNEYARVRVDILSTEAEITRLREVLGVLDSDVTEKSATADKFEVQIRRRNDEIAKKAREVDRLNKQLAKMSEDAAADDSNSKGPLEATLAHLSWEMTQKSESSRELQREWVRHQTELVELTNQDSQLRTRIQQRTAEQTVLMQKRMRLEAVNVEYNREIKEIDNSVRKLRADLSRLNALIAQSSELRAGLENETFTLETTVVDGTLRDLEEDVIRTQVRIQESKEEKKSLLEAISTEAMEVDRQIMLWERRIQIEKEMQAVLDPSAGVDVANEMQKEIHRMKLRYAQLMKNQEQLIQYMERAVLKRENIAVRSRAQIMKNDRSVKEANSKKQVSVLKTKLKAVVTEESEADSRVGELKAECLELQQRAEEISDSVSKLKEEEDVAIGALAHSKKDHLLSVSQVVVQQRIARRLKEVVAGEYKLICKDPNNLSEEMDKAKEESEKIVQYVETLMEEMPGQREALQKAMSMVLV